MKKEVYIKKIEEYMKGLLFDKDFNDNELLEMGEIYKYVKDQYIINIRIDKEIKIEEKVVYTAWIVSSYSEIIVGLRFNKNGDRVLWRDDINILFDDIKAMYETILKVDDKLRSFHKELIEKGVNIDVKSIIKSDVKTLARITSTLTLEQKRFVCFIREDINKIIKNNRIH